jgi:hypothetical protein
MTPTDKRTAHACENHTLAILSTNRFSVTLQTSRAPDASHSLKPAKILSRCPHTWQGVKRLLAPSRRLSELISATYRSQPQKPAKINPYKEFLYNCPPSTFLLSLASLATIVYAPNHQTTEAQRHRGTEAQRHRGTEAQRHRGTEAQRCRGAEVQRCRGAEVQRCRGAEVPIHKSAKPAKCFCTKSQNHQSSKTPGYKTTKP